MHPPQSGVRRQRRRQLWRWKRPGGKPDHGMQRSARRSRAANTPASPLPLTLICPAAGQLLPPDPPPDEVSPSPPTADAPTVPPPLRVNCDSQESAPGHVSATGQCPPRSCSSASKPPPSRAHTPRLVLSRFSHVSFIAGSLHPPGGGGGRRAALLVLLVARLVPVARRRLPLPALLQLGLRIVPTLRPQLHAGQGAPSGQGHAAHAGQPDLRLRRGAERRRPERDPVQRIAYRQRSS